MNIGKNIIAFRKDAGMTQEELANQIGVSAQAVSKWETGVSMPDILLLPVIADVFDITVDEIYSGKRETREAKKTAWLSFDDAPEASYRAILETMNRAWNGGTGNIEDAIADYEENERSASLIAAEQGGMVYTNHEMGLVLRNFGTQKFLKVLESEKAANGLKLLADEHIVRVIRYLSTLGKKMFTAVGIAKRTGMTPEEAESALERMAEADIIYVEKAAVEDTEDIKVYSNSIDYDLAKIMNICLIFRLAERIQSTSFHYRGYRGVVIPVDPEILD